MALVKNGALIEDSFVTVGPSDPIPATGPVIVGLEQWQAAREDLISRDTALGVRLKSDESPELIAADLDRLTVVALEFPVFRDGRAYSYARMLRERFGFEGEIRAVGEVLMEQLHFMLRTGIDAFELDSEDPLAEYQKAVADFSVWYQPTGDGRQTAVQLRARQRQ